MHRYLLVLLTALGLLALAACDEERPEPTDPEGAFRLFQEAIQAQDEDAVWEYLDKGTKELFKDRYRALVRIDRIIEAYFDPSEHKYMRKRTGAFLLEEKNIDGPGALYDFVLNAADITFERDHEVGADVEELTYTDEGETVANMATRGGQVFIFIKEDDGIWRTPSLRKLFENALEPIALSEEAMKEFAKENLLDERERRLKVIEYFGARLAQREGGGLPVEAQPTPAGEPTDETMPATEEPAPEPAPAEPAGEAPATE